MKKFAVIVCIVIAVIICVALLAPRLIKRQPPAQKTEGLVVSSVQQAEKEIDKLFEQFKHCRSLWHQANAINLVSIIYVNDAIAEISDQAKIAKLELLKKDMDEVKPLLETQKDRLDAMFKGEKSLEKKSLGKIWQDILSALEKNNTLLFAAMEMQYPKEAAKLREISEEMIRKNKAKY